MGKPVPPGGQEYQDAALEGHQEVLYSPEEIDEIYQNLREYRNALNLLVRGTENPRHLYRAFVKYVRKLIKDDTLPIEIREHIDVLKEEAKDVLRELMGDRKTLEADISEKDLSQRVVDHVKKVSESLLKELESGPVPYTKVEVSELGLLDLMPDLVFPQGDLPDDHPALRECGYKGGVARVALKRYAQLHHSAAFDKNLLDAELPLSDKDAIFGPAAAEYKHAFAEEMGVDLDGIELRKDFDIEKYLGTRDTDLNEVLLTRDYLYFTPRALESVLSGVVHGNKRGESLFGVDAFYKQGRFYYSGRMMHRLVKVAAQGKAKSFEVPSFNAEVGLGIYWLVLMRKAFDKWVKDPEKGLQQVVAVYECARQMNQTLTEGPQEFLEQLLEEFPQFSFNSHQSDSDVARWILTKYTATVERYLRREFNIRQSFWPYQDTDETPLLIEPGQIVLDDEASSRLDSYIDELLHPSPVIEQSPGIVHTGEAEEEQQAG